MKTMVKLLLGGTVLAAAAAAHAGAILPSSDDSNLLFFVTNAATAQTYTVVLSQALNSNGSYFTTADAQSGGAPASLTNIYGDAGFSDNFTNDTALQSFITAGGGLSSGNFKWGILAAAYGSGDAAAPGTSLAAFTSYASSTTAAANNVKNGITNIRISSTIPTDFQTDVGVLNTSTFDSFNGTTSGVIGTSASQGGNSTSVYGAGINNGSPMFNSTTAVGLYAATGGGDGAGKGIDFYLGSLTFNGDILTFTGNQSPVPLPAAAWLLGSGLLGLLGIGRRRQSFAVAA